MDENETMLTVAHNLRNVKIEDEMKNCYIDYAMSVIIGRALPDVFAIEMCRQSDIRSIKIGKGKN